MYQLCCDYLRPKKGAHLAAWHAEAFEKRNSLQVWSGRDATVLPVRPFPGDSCVHGRGGVADQAGAYVPLSAYPGRVEGGYQPEGQIPYRDEKAVFCGHYIKHWGHFLVEIICRLWYCLEHDSEVDKYVFIACPDEPLALRSNYAEFFRLLGILDKVEIIDTPVQFREVIVPELSFCLNRWYCDSFLDIYNRVADRADPPLRKNYPEEIYFTRSQLVKQNDLDVGAEVLDNFFEKNGYCILAAEKLSLSEMIHYVRNAKTVAAISGTLMHNILFGYRGQCLQIFERCVVNNDWQVSVNRIMELNVCYVDANIPIYTVPTSGPFLIAYNELMQRFAADNNMVSPDEAFWNQDYLVQCFRRYMQTYQDLFRYQWNMEPRYMPLTEYMQEAYDAGREQFGDYLFGRRPFRWHHYLEIHYWKQYIKRLLKRA